MSTAAGHAGGQGTGRQLHDRMLAATVTNQPPVVYPNGPYEITGRETIPYWINQYGGPPVKYTTPSATKERFVAREAIRRAAIKKGQSRPDPITDEEVDYLQSMQDVIALADFDQWVNAYIDPRKPGNAKIMGELYPEFIARRNEQLKQDYDFALRKQLIDMWGVNTFDDLHFLYLCDQGILKGPSLSHPWSSAELDKQYKPGPFSLAPNFFKRKRANGIRLPYASAGFGQRPQSDDQWVMPRTVYPSGGDIHSLAHSMYGNNDQRFANTGGIDPSLGFTNHQGPWWGDDGNYANQGNPADNAAEEE